MSNKKSRTSSTAAGSPQSDKLIVPSIQKRDSLFAENASATKLQTLYFYLPGSIDIYTTKNIKNGDDSNHPISSWPLNDLALGRIPAGNFFLEDKEAYTAAKKAFSKIGVCIIKLYLPEKLSKEILKNPNRKSKPVFEFDIMPLVESITAYTSAAKFNQGILYQNSRKNKEFTFVQQSVSPASPGKK